MKQYPAEQKTLLGLKLTGSNRSVLDVIKELFYSIKKNKYELFREVATGNKIDADGFHQIVAKHSNNVLNEADTKAAFMEVVRLNEKPSQMYKDYLTWQEFEAALTVLIPDPEQFQDESRIL